VMSTSQRCRARCLPTETCCQLTQTMPFGPTRCDTQPSPSRAAEGAGSTTAEAGAGGLASPLGSGLAVNRVCGVLSFNPWLRSLGVVVGHPLVQGWLGCAQTAEHLAGVKFGAQGAVEPLDLPGGGRRPWLGQQMLDSAFSAGVSDPLCKGVSLNLNRGGDSGEDTRWSNCWTLARWDGLAGMLMSRG
jgi:hypothetical protein